MNRPERINSQTIQMFHEDVAVARALRIKDLRALIVTRTGDREFCPGFDLDEMEVIAQMTAMELTKFQDVATGGIQEIRSLSFQ